MSFSSVSNVWSAEATYRDYLIFEENWDGNNIPSAFPNTRGAIYNGWEVKTLSSTAPAYSQGYAELSTDIYHSFPRSLYERRNAREVSTRDLKIDFAKVKEIRMRYYIYFDKDFVNFDNDNVHLVFLQSALSGTGVRMDLMTTVNKAVGSGGTPNPPLTYMWPPTCSDGTNGAFIAINSPQSQLASTFKGVKHGASERCFNIKQNLERWIPVEWAYKIVDDKTGYGSLWIDNNEMMKDELIPPDARYMDIGMMQISGWLSQGTTENVGPTGFYMDDIIVTSNYDVPIDPIESASCTEAWTCSAWSTWSACANSSQSQTRTCTDTSNCGTLTGKPVETQTQACTSSQTGDTTPPDLWSRSPVPDATNVSHTNRNISLHIGDGTAFGVNSATIKLNVNGQDYCCQTGSCTNKTLSCAGSPGDYLVTYTNSNDWSSGQKVNLTADASDSATPPNAMTQRVWSFTVENYATTITYNLTNFTQLVSDWLKTISSSPADVNKDGKVNSQDLGIMMSNWGQ